MDKRKIAFRIIMFILPIVLIILIEITLRQLNYGTSYELFVPTPTAESPYLGLNIDAPKKYFNTIEDIPTPRKDLFLKTKPKNGYRIFVLGGSTVAGFPFGNNLTFTRILNRRLSDVFPTKKIEIINTAFTAINTYTQLDFMDDIIEHEPDAILIYSGHNEYFGALGVGSMESLGKKPWIIKSILTLKEYRTYQLIENLTNSIVGLFSEDKLRPEQINSTMMERIVKKKSIPLDSEEYKLGINQFHSNLEEIIKIAQENNIKIILSELVSNLKDQPPFQSVKSQGNPLAIDVYKKALDNEKNKFYNSARKNFIWAKDLDGLRFRAPEAFNEIIVNLGQKYSIPVVPMRSVFESNSSIPIIGNELMLEHLHPNKAGYFLMADAFFKTLQENIFVDPKWDYSRIKPSSFYENYWGFTNLDSVHASLSINQLKGGWPFKINPGQNTFLDKFQPFTLVDSLALQIIKNNNYTLEQAHIQMASRYEQEGKFDLAFNEYKALIYTVPYFDLFYEPAIKILGYQKKYAEAINLLTELEEYQGTEFVNKWKGQFYLANQQPKNAIPYLEKFVRENDQDEVVVHNLCRAYYNISEIENGDRVLKILKNNNPNSKFISTLEDFRLHSKNKVL